MRAARTQRRGDKTDEEREELKAARIARKVERQKVHDLHKEKEKEQYKIFGKSKFERKDSNVRTLFINFSNLHSNDCHLLQTHNILFFGDGACSPSFGKGYASYGSQGIKRALVQRGLLVMVDEHKTSKLCSCCSEEVF
jgi:hypothetical protein